MKGRSLDQKNFSTVLTIVFLSLEMKGRSLDRPIRCNIRADILFLSLEMKGRSLDLHVRRIIMMPQFLSLEMKGRSLDLRDLSSERSKEVSIPGDEGKVFGLKKN